MGRQRKHESSSWLTRRTSSATEASENKSRKSSYFPIRLRRRICILANVQPTNQWLTCLGRGTGFTRRRVAGLVSNELFAREETQRTKQCKPLNMLSGCNRWPSASYCLDCFVVRKTTSTIEGRSSRQYEVFGVGVFPDVFVVAFVNCIGCLSGVGPTTNSPKDIAGQYCYSSRCFGGHE